MKLIYIANVRLPTEKAHGIQIMKMCEAFAKNDVDVTLVVPFRIQTNEFLKKNKNVFDYYLTDNSFKIVRLPNIDLLF